MVDDRAGISANTHRRGLFHRLSPDLGDNMSRVNSDPTTGRFLPP